MIGEAISRFIGSLEFERSMAANTYRAYDRDLRYFKDFLEKRGITDERTITREHIAEFLETSRIAGLKGSTRARRTAAIRTWMMFMKQMRMIEHNPAELLDSPRKSQALPRTLSEAEVFAMLDAVSGSDAREVRDRAMLEVMYGCGLRVSELCDLKVEDLVSEGELVRIIGKGSKERVVPIGGAAGRAIADYRDGGARASFLHGNTAETHMFLTRRGGPFTRQGVFKIIRERAMAVGIAAERISPHVMRHCFASHMLQHGADIRAIQEMLGHADIGTTQIYTHVDQAHFREIHKLHPRHLL